MYAKLFASIYQGTLRGNTNGLVVFTNMLAHADSSGWVDIHPKAIAEEVGLTIEQVQAAINELESPDPDSRSPEEEGRRIVRMDEHRAWGWVVVNHAKYRAIRNEDDRREQNRIAQQRFREKSKQSKPRKPMSAQAEAEAEADTSKPIGNSLPRCPVDKIVSVFHDTLPELPKTMVMTPKREDAIKARWKQIAPESTEDGIDSFREFFKLVSKSDFLMGRKDPINGHKRFFATLEWLVNPANFAKVIERNYHERV